VNKVESPASTTTSLRPRLSTVSIMPGMDTEAPDRTERSSGLAGSPSFLPEGRAHIPRHVYGAQGRSLVAPHTR